MEVRRRIQAGANAWRKVHGKMMDRKISRKLGGEGLGFLCSDSYYVWPGDGSSVRTAKA